MDEEVLHSIDNAMEMEDQDLSQTESKTDQRIQDQVDFSVKAREPPINPSLGDDIDLLPAASGSSIKAKAQVKRSRKRGDVVILLRESLHREAKSVAREKIRNAITGSRMRYNPIVKKSQKKVMSRLILKKDKAKKRLGKRKMPKKNNTANGEKKVKKRHKKQHVLRLSPVPCNSESSVSESQVSGKGSTESSGSQSSCS